MKNTTTSGSLFKAGDVTLTDGIFKISQEVGREYLKSFDIDRLLAPVAYSAGAITDTSAYYGGWEAYDYRGYTGKGISGHSLGHWMSAAADMYAVTGDKVLYDRLCYAVSKLAEYQEKDGTGYIGGVEKTGLIAAFSGKMDASAFDISGYWVPWYSFHKIYQGLIDAYQLADIKNALRVVCRFADWAEAVTKDMSDDKFNEMLKCEYGGMNEVMAELYEITGEEKYLRLAKRFCESGILQPLSECKDELQGKHANTQIPKVIGAAAVYNADNSREEYKRAAEFFFDTVVNHRSYVIGGNSNYEHFGSQSEEILGVETLETCNTYNMLRLTEQLYAWKHDAAYMDYYERALLNHILSSQDPKTGEKTYFMATKPGHFKVYSDGERGHSFWCCMGSGMENPGRYTRDIYYKDGDNLYVNLFISSNAVWREKGVKISQKTNFPYEETVEIKIDGECDAAINIRIPSWISSKASVSVNGGEAEYCEAGYYKIKRAWKSGDTISVRLPMALHTYVSRDDEHKAAFMYGPTVLAGALGGEAFPCCDNVDDHTSLDTHTSINVPDIIVTDKSPESFIKAVDLSKLEFEMVSGDKKIKLIPYFALHHERYSLYWQLYGEDEAIERDNFVERLDAVTVDTVRPNEQQPEVDHGMKKNNSMSGYLAPAERGWRIACGSDGYFSYDINTDTAAEKNYVLAVYWGSDAPFTMNGKEYTRKFEILANDAVIAREELNNNSSGKLIYAYYELPKEITKGGTATVKFRPESDENAAGGVFEVRIVTDVVKRG